MHRGFRKPLIIMTPKSLLRHPLAKSTASEFIGDGHFMRILSDTNGSEDAKTKRLVLCSGKVAYDLIEARNAAGLDDTQIVRIEQIYPFPGEPLATRIKRMTALEEVVWCQEEPKNNGSWFFVEPEIEEVLAAATAALEQRKLKPALTVSVESNASDAPAAAEKLLANGPEAMLLALAVMADTAAAEDRPPSPGRSRNSYADPSAVIAAELAFARLAQEKGQWTAFAATAANDAVMFEPQMVLAQAWLKGRANPPEIRLELVEIAEQYGCLLIGHDHQDCRAITDGRRGRHGRAATACAPTPRGTSTSR